MPFSIRRFTLQRSLSSSVTETKSQGSAGGPDMVGAGRAIRKSASQEEGRLSHNNKPASFPASRSADGADPRRTGASHGPPSDRPPRLPPRGPQRAVSVDRGTSSSSSSILSRWRQAGKSKSVCISEPREYPLDDDDGSRHSYGPPPPSRSLRVGVRFQGYDGVAPRPSSASAWKEWDRYPQKSRLQKLPREEQDDEDDEGELSSPERLKQCEQEEEEPEGEEGAEQKERKRIKIQERLVGALRSTRNLRSPRYPS